MISNPTGSRKNIKTNKKDIPGRLEPLAQTMVNCRLGLFIWGVVAMVVMRRLGVRWCGSEVATTYILVKKTKTKTKHVPGA